MAWQDFMTDKTAGMPTVGNGWNAANASVPTMDFSSLLGYSSGAGAADFGMPAMQRGPMNLSSLMNLGKMGMKDTFGGFLDTTDMATGMKTQGWGMPVISAANGLMSGFLGLKNYGLQKDALKQSKKEFEMNWGAQQKMVNSEMEDRQRARIASNPNAYQSVGDYMKKNGI